MFYVWFGDVVIDIIDKKVSFFLFVVSRSNTFACKDNNFIVVIKSKMSISAGNNTKTGAELVERIEEADKQERWVAPEKFWKEKYSKKKNEVTYTFNWVALLKFLESKGYHSLNEKGVDKTRYVRISGQMVQEISPIDIQRFVYKWANEHALNEGIRNLILNSSKLKSSRLLELLSAPVLDFTNCTPNSQFFYFKNTVGQLVAVEVTAEGIKEHVALSDWPYNVWEKKINPHRYTKLKDMFEITSSVDESGRTIWDIDVKDTSSPFFGLVINTSRIHWRKELEEQFKTTIEREAYHAAHKFDIAGEGLTEKEVQEQKLNLINKIFTIGYILHRYKDPSRAWAPLAMDHNIGQIGLNLDMTGKHFFFRTLSQLLSRRERSGKKRSFIDKLNVFDDVDKQTDFVLITDCAKTLPLSRFHEYITESWTINPKKKTSFTIPFEEAPKIAFISNYIPAGIEASTHARLLPMVFSDYYHWRDAKNNYLETRVVTDDIGPLSCSEAPPEADWNRNINFMMQCCCFYLKTKEASDRIFPTFDRTLYRK